LFEFAERAVKLLRAKVPAFLCDGLVRVDIFCNAEGMVVNEFESLEATHFNANHTIECIVSRMLSGYWLSVLNKCVQKILLHKASSCSGRRGRRLVIRHDKQAEWMREDQLLRLEDRRRLSFLRRPRAALVAVAAEEDEERGIVGV